MADNLPSDTSIGVLAAATPTRVSSSGGGGGGGGEAESLNVGDDKDGPDSTTLPTVGSTDLPQPNEDAFDMSGHDGGAEAGDASAAIGGGTASKFKDDAAGPTASTSQTSFPYLQNATGPVLAPPTIKRFSSVNINKRFLEKTSSPLSTPQGGSSHTGSSTGGINGAPQRRGTSPGSRSPSTDRPAPSRLVTAKLTATPQASMASTSGWLRTGTPGNSTGSSPPSSSPQPPAHEAVNAPSLQQTQSVKRRPGGSPIPNGHAVSISSQTSSQQGSKPAWGKVPVAAPKGGLNHIRPGAEIQHDFPTAAEAVHGRKLKTMKVTDAETAAAAQKEAEKQAMNETAAAFRGAHLDANVRHWDEMEDEDNDFLDGVIEFGDGTQYKIEQKPEQLSKDEPAQQEDSGPISVEPQQPVTKEERFGQDIGRNWPRSKPSPVQSTSGLQPPGTQQSPVDGNASASPQSPHDSTSATSRVLFNERSNRLEPWSNAKAPFMPPRQQGLTHPQGREAQSNSQLTGNVQLLQKGPSGPDSVWKSGQPRGFGTGADRGRRGEAGLSRGPPSASAREEGQRQPWDLHRRESISSAAGSSVRDRSRGREKRWDNLPPASVPDRNRNRRDSSISQPSIPILPDALARDRSRERSRQLPSHIRMPPPPVPATKNAPDRDPSQRPSTTSPSLSARSLTSPQSERPVTIPVASAGPGAEASANEVDKDALVKDAMQLAIERARKRKQEGEEEEKRRLEAVERARKKAEELAALLEEKKKADTSAEIRPARDTTQLKEPPRLLVKAEPLTHGPSEVSKATKNTESSSTSPFASRNLQDRQVSTLLRKPSDTSPATQADSWRRGPVLTVQAEPSTVKPAAKSDNRVATVEHSQHPSSTPDPVPERRGVLLSNTEFMVDLSEKPDEELEIVDFCDLGKFMGDTDPVPSELPVDLVTSSHAGPSMRARRPVASDFFDKNQSDSSQLLKIDQGSWRRPVVKPGIPTSPPADELRAQSMPIFSAEESLPEKELGSNFDSKRSPSITASPSKPILPHGDQASSTSASQSTHLSPVVSALRSPRSHFKEAPMSTLTDTMSRIKGALVGMQIQELPAVPPIRETPEEVSDGCVSQMDMLGLAATSRRSQQDALKAASQQHTSMTSSIASTQPVPTETFDVTRSPPPVSPRPVWNTFAVKLPKISRTREMLSKRQLRLWNLPYGPVRWNILSWDPPVEGMNKRELSCDELLHRKLIKGAKPRVLLPNNLASRPSQFQISHEVIVTSRQTLVSEAGVKIKLPGVLPPRRPDIRKGLFDRPRDSSSVPSWRRSATPLVPLKAEKANANVSDYELNITSRSPPPEPSTPLPQINNPKITSPPRPQSERSPTVSLPPIDAKPFFSRRSSSGPDVAFFRTSKGEPDAHKTKPLPRFTVTSELDSNEASQTIPLNTVVSSDSGVAMSQTNLTHISQDPPAETVVQRLLASKSDNRGSEESGSTTRPQTPPLTHNNSTWGKSPLSFSLKESPSRSAPDPEHLKAVWLQSSGHPSGSTSNSLKGITDDLPSIPFNVQDMKSEDGGTPPPTAPMPAPSRLSLQEVTRAFQQVPDSPANRQASYAQTPLLSQNNRNNQPIGASFPPPPSSSGRPAFAPYPHAMLGHSPSPTMMYAAPGMSSPISHHQMAVNGPSPPVVHGMWLPTPSPAQPGTFMRPANAPPGQAIYPPSGPVAPPSATGQMAHRRMSGNPPGSLPPPAAPMYTRQMDMNHMHPLSPHMAHAPVGHPMQHMHVTHVFSPPQPVQPPAMYAVPVGAGRGGLMPRPGYDGYGGVPVNPGFQPVPSTSFVFQS